MQLKDKLLCCVLGQLKLIESFESLKKCDAMVPKHEMVKRL